MEDYSYIAAGRERLKQLSQAQHQYYRQQALLEQQTDLKPRECGKCQQEAQARKELAQIENMAQAGIQLTLNGVPASPKDIVNVCMLRERGEYMRDYIADNSGKIVEVRFDRLS